MEKSLGKFFQVEKRLRIMAADLVMKVRSKILFVKLWGTRNVTEMDTIPTTLDETAKSDHHYLQTKHRSCALVQILNTGVSNSFDKVKVRSSEHSASIHGLEITLDARFLRPMQTQTDSR